MFDTTYDCNETATVAISVTLARLKGNKSTTIMAIIASRGRRGANRVCDFRHYRGYRWKDLC